MIPPRIHDFINNLLVQRSLLSDGMVRDTNVRDLFTQVLDRKGRIRFIPCHTERRSLVLLNTTIGKSV